MVEENFSNKLDNLRSHPDACSDDPESYVHIKWTLELGKDERLEIERKTNYIRKDR